MATRTLNPISPLTLGWNYHVTLSYAEEEEETTEMTKFIGKLYASLNKANFKTFKGNKQNYPERGGEQMMISDALKKGIQGSRCAVIIFSKNFASSTRCLEEVAFMMECKNKLRQKVFPVFLMGVEGSDVRGQKGDFGKPFCKHEEFFKSNPDVVKRWRSALKMAGELVGLNFKDIPDRDEEKLIAKIVQDVSDFLSEIPPPDSVREMNADPVTQNQPSIQRMLQHMLGYIDDPEIDIIGLCGMGGVGKTTLAKELNNHLKEEVDRGIKIPFDHVIMVTVSATPNVVSIQTRIGNRLGLDLPKDDEDDAKEKLFDVLRKKKFLLILDDVWPKSKLKLEGVGVPHPRRQKVGSKILVISRNKDVCTDMGATAKSLILVEPLPKDESWNLFVEFAGQHVTDPGIRCFARKIVKRCKGLPLAIITVARAMANRNGAGEWEDAVREMEQSATNLRGMEEDVFVPLKFSFDRLEDDMLRGLFLYCAYFFPEDHDIQQQCILDYCIGKGLVDKLGSLTFTRNKCDALIGSLKIACMLEDGEYDEEDVRMHDMLRELGIWIIDSCGYSDGIIPNKALTRSGISIKEAPQAHHEWPEATRISLTDTQIDKFPELLLLLLRNKTVTVFTKYIIPTNFFQHMDHLTVLDLSRTYALKSLPDSLSCLVSLRVLRLRNCIFLGVLPALGMLRQLQVLDLWGCDKLSRQILNSECVGGISNLRYLDVTRSKVSFQQGAISHLRLLEELNIMYSEAKWRVSDEEDNINEEEGISGLLMSSSSSTDYSIRSLDVSELSHLTNLEYLEVSFKNITISDCWFKPLAHKMRQLSLTNCSVRQDALEALNGSQKLEYLRMEDCLGVTCVPTCISSIEIEIENCTDLEKVMEEEKAYHHPASITFLWLIELPKLKRIIGNNSLQFLTPINCFGQLQRINIWNFHRLKMVFTKEMPRLFNNLKTITVRDCDEMEVILEEEEEEVVVGEESSSVRTSTGGNIKYSLFPRLEWLRLENLLALHDVCSNNHLLHCPLIKQVTVNNCPKLNKDTPLTIQNDDKSLVVIDGLSWPGNLTSRVKKEHEIQALV